MSELYLLAGTVAIRTHATLARRGFYVCYHTEFPGVLAQCMGVVRNHGRSRADIAQKVKLGTSLLVPGWWDGYRTL